MLSTKVTVRMDKDVKIQLENVLNNIGMNLSTGINVLARATIRHGGIPFELNDPFYSEANMKALRESIGDADAGKLTEHELIEV
jgi:DNA-damage-inducible protein J